MDITEMSQKESDIVYQCNQFTRHIEMDLRTITNTIRRHGPRERVHRRIAVLVTRIGAFRGYRQEPQNPQEPQELCGCVEIVLDVAGLDGYCHPSLCGREGDGHVLLAEIVRQYHLGTTDNVLRMVYRTELDLSIHRALQTMSDYVRGADVVDTLAVHIDMVHGAAGRYANIDGTGPVLRLYPDLGKMFDSLSSGNWTVDTIAPKIGAMSERLVLSLRPKPSDTSRTPQVFVPFVHYVVQC